MTNLAVWRLGPRYIGTGCESATGVWRGGIICTPV